MAASAPPRGGSAESLAQVVGQALGRLGARAKTDARSGSRDTLSDLASDLTTPLASSLESVSVLAAAAAEWEAAAPGSPNAAPNFMPDSLRAVRPSPDAGAGAGLALPVSEPAPAGGGGGSLANGRRLDWPMAACVYVSFCMPGGLLLIPKIFAVLGYALGPVVLLGFFGVLTFAMRGIVDAAAALDPPGLGELGRLLAGPRMKACLLALQTLNVSEASPH